MVRNETVRNFVVLGIDITSYSEKALVEQKSAQETVDRLLSDAVGASPLGETSPPVWLDGGDGGYAVFTWGERDVLELLDHFSELLDRENKRSAADHRVTVRMALHIGQIIQWQGKLGQKFTGHTLNECARLLSGMKRERGGQVVCSGPFYDSLATFGSSAKMVRLTDTVDKHGHRHETYNLCRDPGFGIDPPEEDLIVNPFER
jgi:hypothetical protein